MLLIAKTRQHLKAKAHKLKPVVMLGNKGFSAAVQKEVEIALNDHELIKIRVACEDREEKKALVAEICAATKSELVQLIGKIAVIYKQRK
jgi:RNA-binding protein